jgi:hypothetical protein
MPSATLRELRDDFVAAISSSENDVRLDPSIGRLRDKISTADFLEPFSIYSRGHLRRIDDSLRGITTSRLKNDPLRVALAVESIFELLARLETTVEQTAASNKWIEANRSS